MAKWKSLALIRPPIMGRWYSGRKKVSDSSVRQWPRILTSWPWRRISCAKRRQEIVVPLLEERKSSMTNRIFIVSYNWGRSLLLGLCSSSLVLDSGKTREKVFEQEAVLMEKKKGIGSLTW